MKTLIVIFAILTFTSCSISYTQTIKNDDYHSPCIDAAMSKVIDASYDNNGPSKNFNVRSNYIAMRKNYLDWVNELKNEGYYYNPKNLTSTEIEIIENDLISGNISYEDAYLQLREMYYPFMEKLCVSIDPKRENMLKSKN